MASIRVGKNTCSGGVCVLCWLLAIDLESYRSSNMATGKAEIAAQSVPVPVLVGPAA
jgi:hypothetical protein